MSGDETDLFDERKSLSKIRDYARERMVAPFAVLASVILRANTAAPAHVMISPMIGTPKPLNMAVITVGPSGLGKTASDDVAEEYWPAAIPVYPLGTAEGAVQAFDPDENGQPQVPNIIFASSEIDNWAALGERTGSLTFPVFRQIITGDQIGQKNASRAHTRVVNKRSYRAGLSLSAQPGSKGASIMFADAPGGFPQRCIFALSTDPDAPDELPAGVEPYKPERVPDFKPNAGPYYEIPFPETVAAEIRGHRRKVLRGEPGIDPLDGHRNLTAAKVAAGLMILEGRNKVTEDDWRIAARIMEISDRTRADLIAATQQAARAANRARALAAAEREEIGDDRRLLRTREAIERWLSKVPSDGWLARRDLLPKIKANLRGYFDEALAQLIETGRVAEKETERGRLYCAVPRYSGTAHAPTSTNDGCTNAVPVQPNPSKSPGKTACIKCGAALGATGKCVPCIVRRARETTAQQTREASA